jgi:ribosomal protein L40E
MFNNRMTRILFCSIFSLLFAGRICFAVNWTPVSESIRQEWNVTSAVQNSWDYNGLPTPYLREAKKPANTNAETIAVVYMARQLVPNGGYFCATQLRSRNNSYAGGTMAVWTQYQEVSGGSNCHWLCAPGYTGENCKIASGTEDCDSTLITKSALSSAGYRESGTYDDSSVEESMNGKAFLAFGYSSNGGNEADVIVVAKRFGDHAIDAVPVTFGAFCGPAGGTANSGCSGGTSALRLVDNKGKERKLCMRGYSGPNCTVPAGNSSVTCGICPDGQHFNKGVCYTCTARQKWDGSNCINKKAVSATDLGKKECLGEFDNVEYRKCLGI